MGQILITSLVTAFAVALGHHLGLVEKVSEVVAEVASCARCSVFWAVLAVLLVRHTDIVISVGIAMAFAYATDWFGILLYKVSNMYDGIWQRLSNLKRRSKGTN